MSEYLKYNLYGYGAILLWSFAALIVNLMPSIPPLFIACLSSSVALFFYILLWCRKPARFKKIFSQPPIIWVLFFASVVAYRGFYLTGLKLAPIVEANLLNYLWPLLIVLLPAFIDKKSLSKYVVTGAVCCFAGVVCIAISKKISNLSFEPGHFLAIAAAITWAVYSIYTKRHPGASLDMIGIMHFIAAILFYSLHVTFEKHLSFADIPTIEIIYVAYLGAAAFAGYILWDKAMTHGDREKIAVAAYYTPLLSTLWLILLGNVAMSPLIWLAACLILGGSLFARFKSYKIK